MDKRGELTSQEIAVLVLTIGGFVLVFLFLFAIFDNKSLTDRELCRLSILERSTLPAIAERVIPLQCNTEKICITVDKGLIQTVKDKISGDAISEFSETSDCKQFAGEPNVRTVEVKLGDLAQQTEAIRTIEKETANAIFDCWAMTGQGKLDAFRGEGSPSREITAGLLDLVVGGDVSQIVKEIKPKCIVCSRVALSEELVNQDKKVNILSRVDVNSYMAREIIPLPGSTLTYLQKLTDESVRSYAGIDKTDKTEEGNKFAVSSLGGPQIAIIFMQIKTEGKPADIAAQAAIMTGTAIGGGGLLTAVGRKVITTFPVISTLVALAGTGGAYLAAENSAKANQAISYAACSGVEKDGEKARMGCSLVKPIAWDIKAVNNMCIGGIEGNL